MNVNTFKNLCDQHVSDLLESSSFAYSKTVVRPRGVILEYRRSEDSVILGWDERELIVDLILKTAGSEWMRVSVNQLLWFLELRALVSATTCEEKLQALRAEFSNIWSVCLNRETACFDPRYCFKMNDKDYGIYMRAQFAGRS